MTRAVSAAGVAWAVGCGAGRAIAAAAAAAGVNALRVSANGVGANGVVGAAPLARLNVLGACWSGAGDGLKMSQRQDAMAERVGIWPE